MSSHATTTVFGGPQYGKRLIVNIIDETAEKDPDRQFLAIPRSSDPKDGWRDITFREFANVVNRFAHRIVETFGEAPPKTFPTFAYIGPNDVRYVVLMAAAVKAGYQVRVFVPTNIAGGPNAS